MKIAFDIFLLIIKQFCKKYELKKVLKALEKEISFDSEDVVNIILLCSLANT